MRPVVVVVPRPVAGPTQHADRALFAPFLVPGGIGRYVKSLVHMLVVLVVQLEVLSEVYKAMLV